MARQKIHSGYDSDGRLYVACSECARGGNGDKSCGAGGTHKHYHGEMCFCGEPLQWVQDILLFEQTNRRAGK